MKLEFDYPHSFCRICSFLRSKVFSYLLLFKCFYNIFFFFFLWPMLCLLQVSPGDTGWDVFSLDYHVDGPIATVTPTHQHNFNVAIVYLSPFFLFLALTQATHIFQVFTRECMSHYLRVFNFLWRAKRMEYTLTDIWKGQMCNAKLLKTMPGVYLKNYMCVPVCVSAHAHTYAHTYTYLNVSPSPCTRCTHCSLFARSPCQSCPACCTSATSWRPRWSTSSTRCSITSPLRSELLVRAREGGSVIKAGLDLPLETLRFKAKVKNNLKGRLARSVNANVSAYKSGLMKSS